LDSQTGQLDGASARDSDVGGILHLLQQALGVVDKKLTELNAI
jgi:hypothetical protein